MWFNVSFLSEMQCVLLLLCFDGLTVRRSRTRARATSNAHRPEIVFTYNSAETTTTKLIVNEPCGFMLPPVLKRLQEFFDVASDSDLLSANPEPSSYGVSQVLGPGAMFSSF